MPVHAIHVGLILALLVAGFQMKATAEDDASAPEPKTNLRLAQMRGVPEKWNVEANFAVFLDMLELASAQKADLFITPECWLDGYAAPDKISTPDKLREVAQTLDTSPYLQRVAKEARERKMYICFGFSSIEGGDLYNAAGFWNDKGKLLGVYHKTHIQTHDRQYSLGQNLPVWPTPWGPMGIMICADRRWPETARTLRLKGAKLILNPTYGFNGEFNEVMMRTRSYENQCYIAFTHPEQSMITGPKGGVLAKTWAAGPGVFITDIDLSRVRDDNHLVDRRPELYTVITEENRGK
jgi:predicted amidohydrolase